MQADRPHPFRTSIKAVGRLLPYVRGTSRGALATNAVRRRAYRIREANVPGFYSQYGQDHFVAGLFKDAGPGTFLDIGAHDGVSFSNTCYFEKTLRWSGICVEPHPTVFERLLENRSSVCANYAVGVERGKTSFVMFDGYAEMLSGIESLHGDVEGALKIAEAHDCTMESVEVEVIDVASLMEQEGVDSAVLISLDIEGGEVDILRSIDLEAVQNAVIIVENKTDVDVVESYLVGRGYRLAAIVGTDDIYVHRPRLAAFVKSGLA
jgi:FkbM family methyltransferase